MNKNILIIEDENLIRKSLTKLLAKRGAKVDGIAEGKKAISLILNNHYDRIVCDLMLQDITGFDIVEEASKNIPREELERKFIIMTAYTSHHVLSKIKKYNFTILTKPFTNIENALDQILGSEK